MQQGQRARWRLNVPLCRQQTKCERPELPAAVASLTLQHPLLLQKQQSSNTGRQQQHQNEQQLQQTQSQP